MIKQNEARFNVQQEVIIMVALRQNIARLTELADKADARNNSEAAEKWRADARAVEEVHSIVSHAEHITAYWLSNGE